MLFQHVVDAVLAIQRKDEAIDLHMVEIMEMQHKTDMDTTWVTLKFKLSN